MKIVIEMDESLYKIVTTDKTEGFLPMALRGTIKRGIILPKGHGRLIDADKIIKYWKPDHNKQFDADYFIHTLEVADTIIEADKEAQDEKEQ